MEHRCGLRRPANLVINFRQSGGRPTAGKLQNISSSGALIHTRTKLPQHAFVFVQFSAFHNPVPAEIARTTPDGFAVEWVEFSPEEVREVMRALAGLRPDPERPAGHDAR